MPKRFVYLLRSLRQPERRYVGLTSDVQARLDAHNAGLSPFTAKYRPWRVTVCLEFADERRAGRFERYLESPSGRAFAKRHFAVLAPLLITSVISQWGRRASLVASALTAASAAVVWLIVRASRRSPHRSARPIPSTS